MNFHWNFWCLNQDSLEHLFKLVKGNPNEDMWKELEELIARDKEDSAFIVSYGAKNLLNESINKLNQLLDELDYFAKRKDAKQCELSLLFTKNSILHKSALCVWLPLTVENLQRMWVYELFSVVTVTHDLMLWSVSCMNRDLLVL
jgi:hypothetical protein